MDKVQRYRMRAGPSLYILCLVAAPQRHDETVSSVRHILLLLGIDQAISQMEVHNLTRRADLHFSASLLSALSGLRSL